MSFWMSTRRSRSRASSGLSINRPISVLCFSERGSKFIEPMKTSRRSITAASGTLTKNDAELALGEYVKEFAVLSFDKTK